jgi:hypothetical protein
MRTIKIRFVKSKNANYHLQRKGWFGRWKDIGYSVDMGYGGFYMIYTAKTKEELLDEVLDKHYQVCRNHVEIIEYPTIKIY